MQIKKQFEYISLYDLKILGKNDLASPTVKKNDLEENDSLMYIK